MSTQREILSTPRGLIRGGARVRGPRVTFAIHVGSIAGTTVAYSLLVYLLARSTANGLLVFSLVPLGLSAWFYGIRGGIIAGLLATPINMFLVVTGTPESLADWAGRGGVIGSVALLMLGIFMGRLVDTASELAESSKELRALSTRLVDQEEESSRRIARELHDEIGQTMTGLKLQLAVAKDSEPVARSRELVQELMERIGRLTLQLRPLTLDDLGLIPALLDHFKRYQSQTGITVRFDQHGLERRFRAEIETAAYRIIQEGLTNVARHARVSEAFVSAHVEDGQFTVIVRDLGAGIDTKVTRIGRSGVAGMRERANALGGRFTIESELGSGTTITAVIPLA